jgi:hypothetical protein
MGHRAHAHAERACRLALACASQHDKQTLLNGGLRLLAFVAGVALFGHALMRVRLFGRHVMCPVSGAPRGRPVIDTLCAIPAQGRDKPR